MHRILPTADTDEAYFSVKVKGAGMKPNYWSSYVLASSREEAERIIKENHADLSLGIQGLRSVEVQGVLPSGSIEDRIMSPFHCNAVVYETDERGYRVHRGMLKDDNEVTA